MTKGQRARHETQGWAEISEHACEVAIPLSATFLEFKDIVQAMGTCKAWRELLLSRLRQCQLRISEGSSAIEHRVRNRERQRFLKRFTGIRNLSASYVYWFDSWVRESSRVLNGLNVLVLDWLSFRPAIASDEATEYIFPTAPDRTTSLTQLYISRYFQPMQSLFAHILLPCHPLQYLLLENFTFLADSDIDLILRHYPLLRGLHVTEAFLLCRVAIPASLAKTLRELTLSKCPRLRSLSLPSNSALSHLDLSFTGIPCDVAASAVHSCPGLHTLLYNQAAVDSENTRWRLHSLSLHTLQAINCIQLTSLSLHLDSLQCLRLSHCQRLEDLSLSSWTISSLDLSMLTSLRSLSLQCARLRRLNLCGCRSLFVEAGKEAPAGVAEGLGEEASRPPPAQSSQACFPRNVYNLTARVPEEGGPSAEQGRSVVEAVARLVEGCPALDMSHFLDWSIAGTILFAMREELWRVFVEHQEGMYRSKVKGENAQLHSPQRAGQARKRSSFG